MLTWKVTRNQWIERFVILFYYDTCTMGNVTQWGHFSVIFEKKKKKEKQILRKVQNSDLMWKCWFSFFICWKFVLKILNFRFYRQYRLIIQEILFFRIQTFWQGIYTLHPIVGVYIICKICMYLNAVMYYNIKYNIRPFMNVTETTFI